MNYKDEKVLESLDSEIQIVQMENFIKQFDNSMKKSIGKRTKSLIVTLTPVIMAFAAIIIFPNPITFYISVGAVGVITTINQIIENKRRYKKYKLDDELNCDSVNSNNDDLEKTLKEGIGTAKDKDFYTETCKMILQKGETENERKYRQVLEKQRLGRTSLHFILEKNRKKTLNKEETMKEIVKEIDTYCIVYNIPLLKINNKDWDCFFDVLYKEFERRELLSEFYKSISGICRFTFAKALINKNNDININDFINNLYYLEQKYGNLGVDIKEKDILKIQKEIITQIYPKRTIYFEKNNKLKNK